MTYCICQSAIAKLSIVLKIFQLIVNEKLGTVEDALTASSGVFFFFCRRCLCAGMHIKETRLSLFDYIKIKPK